MRSLILIAIASLALMPNAASADEWKVVGQSDATRLLNGNVASPIIVSIKISSIIRHGNVVRYSVKWEYANGRDNDQGTGVGYITVAVREDDCSNNTSRNIAYVTRFHDGTVKDLTAQTLPGVWSTVIPEDQTGVIAHRYLCS